MLGILFFSLSDLGQWSIKINELQVQVWTTILILAEASIVNVSFFKSLLTLKINILKSEE